MGYIVGANIRGEPQRIQQKDGRTVFSDRGEAEQFQRDLRQGGFDRVDIMDVGAASDEEYYADKVTAPASTPDRIGINPSSQRSTEQARNIRERFEQRQEELRQQRQPTTAEEIRQSLFSRQQEAQRQEIQQDLYRRQGESISREIERNPPKTAAEIIAVQRSLPSQFQTPETLRAIAQFSSDSQKEIAGPQKPREVYGPPIYTEKEKLQAGLDQINPFKQGAAAIQSIDLRASGFKPFSKAAEFFSVQAKKADVAAREQYAQSRFEFIRKFAGPKFTPGISQPSAGIIQSKNGQDQQGVSNQGPDKLGIYQGIKGAGKEFKILSVGFAQEVRYRASLLGKSLFQKPIESTSLVVGGGVAARGISTGLKLLKPSLSSATAGRVGAGVVGVGFVGVTSAADPQPVRAAVGNIALLGVGGAMASGSKKAFFSKPIQTLRTSFGLPKAKQTFEVQELVRGKITKDVEVEPIIPTRGKQIKTTTEITPEIRTRISRRTTEPRIQKTINVAAKETSVDILKKTDFGESTVAVSQTKGFGKVSTKKLKKTLSPAAAEPSDFFSLNLKKPGRQEMRVFETTEKIIPFSAFSKVGKSREVDIFEGPEIFKVDFRTGGRPGSTGLAYKGKKVDDTFIEIPLGYKRRRRAELKRTLIHEATHTFDPKTKQTPLGKTRELFDNYITKQSERDLFKLASRLRKPKQARKFLEGELSLYPKSERAVEARARIAEYFPKEITSPTTKTGKELARELKEIKFYRGTPENSAQFLRPKKLQVMVKEEKKILSKKFEEIVPDFKKTTKTLGLKQTSELRFQPVRLRREFKQRPLKPSQMMIQRRKKVADDVERVAGILTTKKGRIKGVIGIPPLPNIRRKALEGFKEQQRQSSQAPLLTQQAERPAAVPFRPIVGFRTKGKTTVPIAVELVKSQSLPDAQQISPVTSTKLDTGIKLTPAFKQEILPDVKLSQDLKPALQQRPAIRTRPRFGVMQTPLTRLTPDLRIRQDEALQQDIIPRTKQDLTFKPRPPRRPTPLIPRIRIFPGSTRQKFSRRKVRGKGVYSVFNPKYVASVGAVVFRIKGKRPKRQLYETGLTVRPLEL